LSLLNWLTFVLGPNGIVGKQFLVHPIHIISDVRPLIRLAKPNRKTVLFKKGDDFCLGSQRIGDTVVCQEIMA
jgi:hypothetical protein